MRMQRSCLPACAAGCSWLRVDYEAGLGVCSESLDRIAGWDHGDRTLGEEAAMVRQMFGSVDALPQLGNIGDNDENSLASAQGDT